jgi:hypothetical protein
MNPKSKNKKAIQQNTEAINLFFSCSENASKQVPEFLFQMLAIFTKTDPGYSEEYRNECVMYFEMLHNLITELQPVKK